MLVKGVPEQSKHENTYKSWWRHQMETFSALLAICAGNSPVTGEFPAQRPVTRSFDVFFDLRLNKQLSTQSWGWWFETLSCHYDVTVMITRNPKYALKWLLFLPHRPEWYLYCNLVITPQRGLSLLFQGRRSSQFCIRTATETGNLARISIVVEYTSMVDLSSRYYVGGIKYEENMSQIQIDSIQGKINIYKYN